MSVLSKVVGVLREVLLDLRPLLVGRVTRPSVSLDTLLAVVVVVVTVVALVT